MVSPTIGHTPMRTCRVCRQQSPKSDLQRWIVGLNPDPQIDPSGREPGRGWYVCHRPECSQRAPQAVAGQARGQLVRRQRQNKPKSMR